MDLRRRAVRGLYGLALLALLVSASAMAEDMCAVPSVASADDAIAKFDALRRHDCLGGAACSTAQCKLVSDMLAKNQGAKGAPIGQMQSTLGTLNDAAMSLSESQPGVVQLHGMQARWKLGELAKTDAKSAMTQILGANTKEWQGQNFLVFPNTPFEVNVRGSSKPLRVAGILRNGVRLAGKRLHPERSHRSNAENRHARPT